MLKILLFNYKILNQFVTQTYLKFTLREKRTEKVEDNLYNSILKKRGIKEPLDEGERREWKAELKNSTFKKHPTRSQHPVSSLHGK